MRTHETPIEPNSANQPPLSSPLMVEDTGGSTGLREYFRLLNRRKGVVAGVFLLVLVCVCLHLFQVTPLYTAKAQLTLDLRKTRVTNIEEVVSGLSSESSVIGTEMDILQSSSLVGRVVDKLRLTDGRIFWTRAKCGDEELDKNCFYSEEDSSSGGGGGTSEVGYSRYSISLISTHSLVHI